MTTALGPLSPLTYQVGLQGGAEDATNTLNHNLSPPFVKLTALEVSLPEEDNSLSSVSASSVLPGSAVPTLVCHDFPFVLSIAGLTLLSPLFPKLENCLREGFHGPSEPPQPLFVLPALSDIWPTIFEC